MAPSGFDAVTFDFWNTLVVETTAPVELRGRLWRGVLADAGHDVSSATLDAAFKHAWERFDGRWRANQQSTAAQMTADAAAHLDLGLAGHVVDALADAYLEASLATPRELQPEVEETLDRLRGLGLGVGIVSDIGGVPGQQIERWLGELGVHHLVTHFSFSDAVGAFKPDPIIFDHALSGLGVADPARSAHVGDLRRTDIAGANAHGMTSVHYVGGREDTEDLSDPHHEPDYVITRHLQLLDVLALG
jgi:FMN phosphatase YigB (HAD superfamily)